ncbi:MAG: Gx transporter family protein [Ruminococcaceae bacterium]|nr:Gx transporter family protein [Oscillospiraceae bacterium]
MNRREKIVYTAILTATALILAYVESIISFGVILPGVKLGLSNISVVVALYTIGFPYAVVIGILKCFISLMIFGRLSGLFYSLSGIILAIITMYLLKKIKHLSLLSVNIGGSFFHIIGQLIAASVMLGSSDVWTLFPLLGALSIVSGAITYIPEHITLNTILKIKTKRGKLNVE